MAQGTEIIALIGAAACTFLGFALTRSSKMKEESKTIRGFLWVAGGLAPLAAVLLLWASMGSQLMFVQRATLFVVGAAIGGFALMGLGELIRPTAAVADSSLGETRNDKAAQNVTSYNQQGGITAGVVNIGPQRLAFNEELARDLLAKMPTKRLVRLQTIGGTADQAVGSDIERFLTDNSYKVERIMIGVMAPPPDTKISLRDNIKEMYVLTVAPSAN